jgi:acetyl esterase/lipase
MTSEYDPLRAEGLAYAEALKSANVAVNTYECPKSLHDLIGLSIETEEKNHAFNHLITYLKASKFSAAQ